jgi:hypothetical protein
LVVEDMGVVAEDLELAGADQGPVVKVQAVKVQAVKVQAVGAVAVDLGPAGADQEPVGKVQAVKAQVAVAEDQGEAGEADPADEPALFPCSSPIEPWSSTFHGSTRCANRLFSLTRIDST